ncbi:MAG: DUF2029 domain-containing protein [Bdellovibrionales bacterium]|nr:DUF2029 domain-containing protein [Bdellovibrionales bacterium]
MAALSFWTKARRERLAGAVAVGILLSLLLALISDSSSEGMFRRGDFPAFYAAGAIVLEGLSERLYDPTLQAAIQQRHWPSLTGEFYAFAYPPFVAVLAAPLALLPAPVAKAVFSTMMIAAVLFAVLLLPRIRGELKDQLFSVGVLFAAFAPLTAGVLGGQNTALSLLCYTATFCLLLRRTPRSEFQAGLVLGCWCFKPHFLCIALLLLLAGGLLRPVLGACIPMIFCYFIGAVVRGPAWPLEWAAIARDFAARDLLVNGQQMVSIGASAAALLEHFGIAVDSVAAAPLAVSIVLLLFTVAAVIRLRPTCSVLFTACLIGPTAVLMSPHTLFYDAAICLVPIVALLQVRTDRQATMLLLGIAAVFAVCLFRDQFVIQPLLLFPLWTLWLVFRKRVARV